MKTIQDKTSTARRAAAQPLSASQWKTIALASLGGSLEFYDFIIYGIFAHYIAVLFFPGSNLFASMLLSFSVLAIGFLARPIGGLILGHLGDRYGRRPVFIASLGVTTIATIAIGLLPSYASIGVAAPLLLVLFRTIQGLCLGGELPGAVTYAVEAVPERPGLACGLIILCVNGGVLVATLANLAIQTLLPPEAVASYGWRLAFLFGGVVGIVSFFLRRSLEESPEFQKLHDTEKASPVSELLRNYRSPTLIGFAIAAIIAGFNGMLYGFLPAYLMQSLNYSAQDTAFAMTVALVVSSVGLIVSGWLGDYVSRSAIMGVGALLMAGVTYPLFVALVDHAFSLWLLLGALSLVFSISSGIWPSIIANLFPTKVRFSGIALSYNMSITLLSGFAPLSATILIQYTGSMTAPAFYITLSALISLFASFFSSNTMKSVSSGLKPKDITPLA